MCPQTTRQKSTRQHGYREDRCAAIDIAIWTSMSASWRHTVARRSCWTTVIHTWVPSLRIVVVMIRYNDPLPAQVQFQSRLGASPSPVFGVYGIGIRNLAAVFAGAFRRFPADFQNPRLSRREGSQSQTYNPVNKFDGLNKLILSIRPRNVPIIDPSFSAPTVSRDLY